MTVTDEQTTTCTVEMAPAGLTGKQLSHTSGDPIAGVDIIATETDGDCAGQTYTNASRSLHVGGLETGSDTIEAQDMSANGLSPGGRYIYQFIQTSAAL